MEGVVGVSVFVGVGECTRDVKDLAWLYMEMKESGVSK